VQRNDSVRAPLPHTDRARAGDAAGRYDETLALLLDFAGVPVAEALAAMPTRADRDRPGMLGTITSGEIEVPGVLGTITKADRDRDVIAAELITKPAGERVKDLATSLPLWGPPPG
jgi:hypothetical protein